MDATDVHETGSTVRQEGTDRAHRSQPTGHWGERRGDEDEGKRRRARRTEEQEQAE